MSVLLRGIVLLGVVALMADGAPTVLNEDDALGYLTKYGYLGKNTQNRQKIKDKNSAIKEFQLMAGLKATGTLTNETLAMMQKPRCGLFDNQKPLEFKTMSRWPKKQLTYTISKYPAHRLDRQQVDQEIHRAFHVWTEHTDLTFHVANPTLDRRADIDIRFEAGDHRDGSAFDGPGGTLGHAYFPTNGRAHFDDAEAWTVYDAEGINLFQVAAHEFGHSLGLDHSQVHTALMAPFYQGYQPNFRLDNDDIQGIQQLYGRKTTEAAVPRPPPPPAPPVVPASPPFNPNYPVFPRPEGPSFDKDLCQSKSFDTIFTDLQGVTYVIKGTKYWQLTQTGVASGFPQDVGSKWAGLPRRIDAAFAHPQIQRTYFFSGAWYWRYHGDRLDADYPKLISQGMPGIPDNVDSAFVWPRTKQIYFFKGTHFWKFDYTSNSKVGPEYPRTISEWWRVPEAPDAAFTRADRRTYFAKGSVVVRFDDNTVTVDAIRSTGVLFGCPNFLKVPNYNMTAVLKTSSSGPSNVQR